MSAALKDLRDQVERMLDEADKKAGSFDEDPSTWLQRRENEARNLTRRLTSVFDARIKDDWQGAAVKIAGIRSTSTQGLWGAVRNWLAAADKRIAAGGSS